MDSNKELDYSLSGINYNVVLRDRNWLLLFPLIFLTLQLIVLEKYGPFLAEGWFSDIAYNLNSEYNGRMANDIPYGAGWSTGIGKLFFLIHHAFYKVLGVGLFQARLVTFVCGAILLILVYRWTKKHISSEVATLSTLLLALSPLLCLCLPDARQDVMHCLFAFISFYFISTAVLNDKNLFFFLAGIFSALSVDISYRGVEIVVAVYVFHCVFLKRDTLLKHSVLLLAGSLVSLIYWLSVNVLPIGMENFMTHHLASASHDGGSFSIGTLLTEAKRFLNLFSGKAKFFLSTEIVYLAVLSVVFYKYRLKYRGVSRVLFAWFTICFFIMSFVEKTTLRSPLLMYYPIISIFAGIGLCELFKQKRVLANVTLVMIVLLVSIFQTSRFAVYGYHKYIKQDSDIKGYYEKLRSSVDLSKAIIGSTEHWYAFPDSQYYGGQFYLCRIKELKPADEYGNDSVRTEALLNVFKKREIEYIIADEHFKPSIINYFQNKEIPSKNFLLIKTINDRFIGYGSPSLHGPPYKTEIYKIISYDP
jgi:hypothetical protein